MDATDRSHAVPTTRSRARRAPLLSGVVALVLAFAATLSVLAGGAARAQEDDETLALAPAGGTSGVLAAPAAAPARSAALQAAPTDEPSIIVNGLGDAVGPAERAEVQILVSAGGYDPFGPPVPASEENPPEQVVEGDTEEEAPVGTPSADNPDPAGVEVEQGPARVTEEAMQPIVDALVEDGLAEEDITLVVSPALSSFFGPGGPGGARVDFVVADPSREQINDLVNLVADTADENELLVQEVGVLYDVDDCSELERQARDEAIADARGQAEQLAELLGVTQGELLQASENSFFFPRFSEAEGGCAPNPDSGVFYGPGGGISVPFFDPLEPAEAKAYSTVTMVFAIGNEEAGTGR